MTTPRIEEVKVTKCPRCGSQNIFVSEYLTWYGAIEEGEDEVSMKMSTNGIDAVECADCGHDMSNLDIEFNFN